MSMATPTPDAPADRRHLMRTGALVLACLLSATACGTRLTDEEVKAANRPIASAVAAGQTSAGATSGDQIAAPGDSGTVTDVTVPAGGSTDGGTGSPSATVPPAGGGTTGGQAAASRTCTKQGAPLVLGSVGSWSGLVGANVGGGKVGIQVWAQYINSIGGIACHPVKLIAVDDLSDTARSQAAVQDLVKNQGAQAMVASFPPISFSGFKAGVIATGVPAIGGDQAEAAWNSHPLLFPIGAGADSSNFGGMAYWARQGKTKVATIYCVEAAACSDLRNASVNNASKVGATIVSDAQVSLTQADYTAQCQAAKSAGATQIVAAIDGSGIARLARSCAAIDYVVPLTAPALAAGFDRNDPNMKKMGVTFSGAAWPWFLGDNDAQKLYQTNFKKYAGSALNTAGAAQGWASGMMLVAAIDKLGQKAVDGPITTAMILQGLAQIKNVDLGGLIAPTTYVSGQPAPLVRCYFVAVFGSDGQFKAPNGSKSECLP
jgi:branched-chain amino acid transport system substrate-binding protein